MFPFLRFFIYDDFKDACHMARENLLIEGAGHSSTIYSRNEEHIVYAGDQLPVGRFLVEQVGSGGSANNYYNGLPPTLSLGCGSWGNNSISENLTFRHLLNVTKVSRVLSGYHEPNYEETWNS
jgi:succinate-semialdehyde dehydrogenase